MLSAMSQRALTVTQKVEGERGPAEGAGGPKGSPGRKEGEEEADGSRERDLGKKRGKDKERDRERDRDRERRAGWDGRLACAVDIRLHPSLVLAFGSEACCIFPFDLFPVHFGMFLKVGGGFWGIPFRTLAWDFQTVGSIHPLQRH